MQTVLKYWNQTGLAGHKIAAYFAVDPTDFDEMRAALYLFGNLYIGFNCTQGFETAFDNGTVFDVVKRDRVVGGHCAAIHNMVKGGNIGGSTWGGLFEMTPAAWTKWVAEPYAVASQEWIKNGVTPEGLDVDAANAAYLQVTGQPGPFISTSPTPGPSPSPSQDVDPADVALASALQQLLPAAQTWMSDHGFSSTQLPPHRHGH
jgi:hypothetical protein